ncbi:hypothetical protein WBG78_16360 [Chryseolinea sp. T2]|uniref:hypothetical protein n=1 Tax=Chryseolinea sp. T2 TaxID=3129255 RepID=UPI003078361E
MKTVREKYGLLVIGILVGIAYAIITRIAFGEKAMLASVTYLFLIPTVLGMVPLLFASHEQLRSYRNFIFIPWLVVGSSLMMMVALDLEGLICLIILGAPFFMLATLGAFIVRLVQLNRESKNKGKIIGLLILPFLLSPAENFVTSPSEVYEAKNTVIISSTAANIWENIVEVDEISTDEYESGFFNDLGIPRPVSASVDNRKVGGHRIGHFGGGLVFNELITHYDSLKKVAFEIDVDSKTVSDNVFDQHVLNGNYFRFVDATYTLTELPDGRVELALASKYQLTSKINFYGKFWGDIILEDFQSRLLVVIRKRCEQ